HGILVIGIIGHTLLRMTGRHAMIAGRRRNEGNAAMIMLAVGAALAAIGFVGTFFGNLIKAGVSRQREFLADASAVQFTRNPRGIADALRRIGGVRYRGAIRSPAAPEASHMFFARAITSG